MRKYQRFAANYDWTNDRVFVSYVDGLTSGTLDLGEQELYALFLAYKQMVATRTFAEDHADDTLDQSLTDNMFPGVKDVE